MRANSASVLGWVADPPDSVTFDEVHNLSFRPIPVIVALSRADEATVAAVLTQVQCDVGIPRHFRIAERA